MENTRCQSDAFWHSEFVVGFLKLNQSSGIFFYLSLLFIEKLDSTSGSEVKFILGGRETEMDQEACLHVFVPEVNQEVLKHRLPLGSFTVSIS